MKAAWAAGSHATAQPSNNHRRVLLAKVGSDAAEGAAVVHADALAGVVRQRVADRVLEGDVAEALVALRELLLIAERVREIHDTRWTEIYAVCRVRKQPRGRWSNGRELCGSEPESGSVV